MPLPVSRIGCQYLINAVTGKVKYWSQVTGNPTNQELARRPSFGFSDALLYSSVKHPGYVIVGCIALAGAVWLAWAILRDKQLEKGFDEIAAGATEREVLQKLGRPKRVEKCGEFFGPLPKEELEKCSREYFYASPFAPLMPEYFVFRFDAKNRVSSKSPYSSP